MKRTGRRVAILTACLAVGVVAVAGWLLRRELVLWYHFAPLGRNAQGYLEYRHRQTGIVMVRLPGGTFWMGAQKEDPNGKNYDPEAKYFEGPVHEVTLSPFLIGKYEVTQGQWESAMRSNPSYFKGDDSRPVERVVHEDILEFERKTKLSLPTESQWEYACRAARSPGGDGKVDDRAWNHSNGGGTTHPVGQKASNGFGIHDMEGNVAEWCKDVFDDVFYRRSEATEIDPVSTQGANTPTVRGGSWHEAFLDCRSSMRWGVSPDSQAHFLGFRAAWRWP